LKALISCIALKQYVRLKALQRQCQGRHAPSGAIYLEWLVTELIATVSLDTVNRCGGWGLLGRSP
jgi:hypothetical protein